MCYMKKALRQQCAYLNTVETRITIMKFINPADLLGDRSLCISIRGSINEKHPTHLLSSGDSQTQM